MWWPDSCVYTALGEAAFPHAAGAGWGNVFDGTNSAVIEFYSSQYPLAWVKALVKRYPGGEVVPVDASKADPSFYGMWWIVEYGGEVWATPPAGEYFQVYGAVACDTHGRVAVH